jgi:hypothetical protein
MTLAETQAWLYQSITSGVPPTSDDLELCLADSPALSAREGVAVYASMYVARLIDALRETFPNLTRHLGDETFAALAEDYLGRHPSEHHDIGRAGRLLPAFLRQHPDPERPDLADLAELEWTRQQVFFAAAPPRIGVEAFARLDPEELARSRLLLSPALQILRLDHAVAPLWRNLENGEPPNSPSVASAPLAVWRRGAEVFHCPLPLDEAAALECAARGGALSQICEAFAEREDPATAAHGAIASWMAEGWVAGVERSPAPPDLASPG